MKQCAFQILAFAACACASTFPFSGIGLAAGASSLLPGLGLFGMTFVSSFYFCGLHETVHRTAFKSKT